MSGDDLAETRGIARNNLRKLTLVLARAELLVVDQETPMMLRLARAPDDISLADILRVTDPGLASIECFGPDEIKARANPEALDDVIGEALFAYVIVMQRHSLRYLLAQDLNATQIDPDTSHDLPRLF